MDALLDFLKGDVQSRNPSWKAGINIQYFLEHCT